MPKFTELGLKQSPKQGEVTQRSAAGRLMANSLIRLSVY